MTMPKNDELLTMLSTHNFWRGKNEEQKKKFIKALDALLKADPTNEAAFREAFKLHKQTWGVFNDEAQWTEQNQGNDPQVEYFTAALDPKNFPQFQQLAAVQRVKYKFDREQDKDILINILKNNEEECRAYLADRIPELKQSHPWKPPHPMPQSLLPDDLILNIIRKPIAAQWAFYAIDEASLEVLEELHRAKLDNAPDKFKTAIKKLGLPDSVDLKCIDMDLIFSTISKKVNTRRTELLSTEAKKRYEDYINNLNDTEIFSQEFDELLQKEGDEFRNDLPSAPYKDNLTSKDLIALREQLGYRFINVSSKEGEFDWFVEAIQKNELAEFKEALISQFKNHTYIRTVIQTKEQMNELKHNMATLAVPELSKAIQSMLPERNAGDYWDKVTQLKALDDPKMKLAQFNTELAKIASVASNEALKASIPHLRQKEMEALQQAARVRRLDVQIEIYSPFGRNSHGQLNYIFTQLSVKEQRHFLNSSAARDKHPELPHVLRATDLSVLKKYFPHVVEETLKLLQKENADNEILKGIHNVHVSKILLSFLPRIALTEDQVTQINALFKSETDFPKKAQYIPLVKSIKDIVNIPKNDEKNFYTAFGLKKNGSGIVNSSIRKAINEQHQNNKELLQILESPATHSEVSPKLVRFLLRLEKKATEEGLSHLRLGSYAEIQEIERLFLENESVKEFIEKYIAPANTKEREAFKTELERELSPELFRAIKKETRTRVFDQTPDKISKELDKVEEKLKGYKRNQEEFAKYMKKVGFIQDMNEHHIYNPLFQKKSKEMEAQFKEIEKENEIISSQLYYDRGRLQDYLDSIPYDESSDRIKNIHKELKNRLQIIDDQLGFYAAIKKKLSDILVAINNQKTRNYVYKPESVETFLLDRETEKEEALRLKENAGDPEGDGCEVDFGDNETISEEVPKSRFELEQVPSTAQVRCFDVTYKTRKQDNTEVNLTGRFIYDKVRQESSSSVLKGDHISKKDAGKYIVRKFPMPVEGVSDQELEAARVNFAMTMALQVLLTEGIPKKENYLRLRKGNEDQLKYMFTAFAVLGAKVPGMKFSADLITVPSKSKFDPKTQIGTLGFKEDSLYKTVFKDNLQVKQFIEQAKEQAATLYDNKEAKAREEKIVGATQFFKKKLTAAQEETEKRRKEFGHEPEPKRPGDEPEVETESEPEDISTSRMSSTH
jgi:hypothetical protein